MSWVWRGLLLAWLFALCIVPDPRPLGAPEWAVRVAGSVGGLSEATARVLVTVALRGMGLAVIGVLLVPAMSRVRLKVAAPAVLILSPLLALLTQWLNYGYFPITFQAKFGVVSALLGALLGIALRKSKVGLAALVILPVGLFLWGTSTGISDDLYEFARATRLHVLDSADEIPEGDAGFAKLMEMAFAFAADNSHGTDPVLPNRAAILALGVILGEERVAKVAKREIDMKQQPEADKLRNRITLHGRHDLSQHFWVSAALAVLSDDTRSMSVGIAKEMMDSIPGGSGFSFVDLTADRAGTLFTVAATRDEESARAMQAQIRGGVAIEDFVPDPLDLPEGLSRDEFQAKYGGLGGEGTKKVVEEIRRRLATCEGLR
jgi:hypothetical protein